MLEVREDNQIDEIDEILEETNSLESIETSNISEINSDIEEKADENIPEPNCLALTVRKDYNLTIFKNVFTKTGRLSLKVALSTLVLNFLRMLF